MSKTMINVNIVFEVENDKVDEVLNKLVQILCYFLKCAAIRVDRLDSEVYVNAEFCNPTYSS